MEFKKQLVTPTVAKQYLEANIKNRRIKKPVVLRYAQDMANGRWKEDTGEALKISKAGVVLDGQHRLMAVIKSNTPVHFHIAFDVDDCVFDVLDTGSSRNATDAFKVQGIKNDNVIPSMISTYTLLKNGNSISTHVNYKPTNAITLELYYEREKFWQMVAQKSGVWYHSFAKILPPSIIGGMYALFFDINEEDAEAFMVQLATGIDITNKTIGLLRQKLMQDKMSPRKMPPSLKNALMVKAWNYFRKNEEVKILKFDSVRDNYPIPI